MTEPDDFPSEEQNVAVLIETLREDLADLNWTPAALMDRMRSLGDYRKPQTILRGINRALEGQTKPSGELLCLVRQAVRFKRRLLRSYGNTLWTQLGDGSHTTQVEDFRITLAPQTKGRWLVVVVHKDGYSPAYPRWQETLEAAKHMAFMTLDNAQNWQQEYAEEQAREAAAHL
ncbi:hypothetical protein ACDH60_26215 [Pseudomonas ficuserectae]|uniref:Uncharacterized protein n=2 Tax=Pseudomonas syringae group TaxID=136849 RepID=A0A3M6EKG1_9PSED|nr:MULTISPECIES: hypothetical protein [Pseudomonas syringae group]NAT15219.1 hypothetical protein [Pseudomonas syringae pv. actinidifoliorum]KKY59427.1 hypothetical protein AAY85_00090 [Pseudomonas amygdali pv. lachrymans]KPB98313.1 Uncharacterized protein AC501_2502 [Pseudomonas amygdali pv. lachrymans]NAT59023.1 hypothetical protein [Pseudomonas syringae pv. actinidifoliorum]RML85735.1 hypothetical protein ALQ87_02831 [Pseudomonas savastanoi pv. glycinea]